MDNIFHRIPLPLMFSSAPQHAPSQSVEDEDGLRWRLCAGAAVFNSKNEILIGERIGKPGSWQTPQGGVDGGSKMESVTTAAIRELYEEVGLENGKHVVVETTDEPIKCRYKTGGTGSWLEKEGFAGQELNFVIFRCADAELEKHPSLVCKLFGLNGEKPEFSAVRWEKLDWVVDNVWEKKSRPYQVLKEACVPIMKRWEESNLDLSGRWSRDSTRGLHYPLGDFVETYEGASTLFGDGGVVKRCCMYLAEEDADDRIAHPVNNGMSLADIKDPKVGVLLLNLGGPETGEDVEGFLYNLFADPDIIRLPPLLAPLQSLVALLISKRRAPKSREAYDSIGGGSPILQYTRAQADLMVKSLKERYGIEAKTYIGMRYWYPFTEEALDKIREDGINALVILPLYPQFSISTSGSSLRVLQEEFAKKSDLYGPQKMFHTVIPSWYDRPGYVKSVANLIKEELDSFTPQEIEEGTSEKQPIPKHVLFSAHGVPASYIEAGDPYKAQIEDCVDRIRALLPSEDEGVKVHLSFQSRVGPVEWLRPYTDDVLPSLGEQGVKNLVVVPISFVSEHIETLEEIDIEYRELALESGITNWRRSPALNTDATFIDDMADMVADALNEPSQSITEACVANNVGNLELDFASNEMEISSAGVGGVGSADDLTGRARRRKGNSFFYY
ncbi:hypothetical protein ACHAXT_010289 [Thalassiosira profunda]